MTPEIVQKIPILDLAPQTERLWDELTAAVQAVMRSGHFIMGPQVRAFEREVAEHLGVSHALAVNSGTDALVIALRAMEIGPGDEVIVPPFTFFATAEAVSMVGATPVFVDIEPDTFNIDVAALEAAITPRTRAVIPVHLFGQSADMGPILTIARRADIKVLEDAAQSFGADYQGRQTGTMGDAGALSFFPSKNLGAFGDAGMIVTNDDALAAEAAMLRVHGSRRKYYNETIGYNSRLDEIQAAILRVKLPHVAEGNRSRVAAAAAYGASLSDLPGVTAPTARAYGTHVYHQYTVRIAGGRRDRVKSVLDRMGVGTMVYYPVPVHRLPVYASTSPSLPVAEQAAEEVISLPIGPDLDEATVAHVVACLREALSEAGPA